MSVYNFPWAVAAAIQFQGMLETQIRFRENRFFHILILATALAMSVSAYNPTIVIDWWRENILVFVLLAVLGAAYKSIPLSRQSYVLLFILICFHE